MSTLATVLSGNRHQPPSRNGARATVCPASGLSMAPRGCSRKERWVFQVARAAPAAEIRRSTPRGSQARVRSRLSQGSSPRPFYGRPWGRERRRLTYSAPVQPAGRSIGVVGGGILGTVLALRLAQAGARVTVLERAGSLGGSAGAMDFGGHTVDRFYHVITPADERVIALARELDLDGALRFAPVGAGFFIDGELHPLDGVGDFLRFPALSPLGRARLAWFVALCQLRGSYAGLEGIPLERWLRRHCGDEVTDRIWKPLLDSRLDGRHAELPASYLW